MEPGHVLDIAGEVAEAKPDEIVLADTIGVGVPKQVRELVEGVAQLRDVTGCHFHDTRNTGIANAAAAVEAGATVLDASVGGTGGCPSRRGRRATSRRRTSCTSCTGWGTRRGSTSELIECAEWLSEQLGKELPGGPQGGNFEPVAG